MSNRPKPTGLSPAQRRRIAECPFDETAGNVIEELKRREVQVVDQIDLHREHLAILARLAKSDIDSDRWRPLKRCRGGSCPNEVCSAACPFGFQYRLNELVLEADDVIDNVSLEKFFVTWISTQYFRQPGCLDDLSISSMFQCVRRLMRKAPENWSNAIAVGSVHISFDLNANGEHQWSPHVTMLLAVDSDTDEIKRVLRPSRPIDFTKVGRKFRPVEAVVATNVSNAISYSTKRNVDVRVETTDRRGNRDRQNDPREMPAAAQRELDEYLLRHTPDHRIFLYGLMRTRGGVALRSRQ